MRKFMSCLLLLCSLYCSAQDLYEQENYVYTECVPMDYRQPIVRRVYGGTKIVVEYKGNWTSEMKGAFDYACKIWEEALPTTFPIRVTAVLDENKETNAISKYACQIIGHDSCDNDAYPYFSQSTFAQVKATQFSMLTGRRHTYRYNELDVSKIYRMSDVVLTYYNKSNKLQNTCSFSIENEPYADRYDFVTLVLRDLAKSFGFIWRNTRVNSGSLRAVPERLLPYESKILTSLGCDVYSNGINGDLHNAYLNALRDSVYIEVPPYKWKVASPTKWDSEISLNWFDVNCEYKLAKLLSPNFGRGTFIRDISEPATYNAFKEILNWQGELYTSIGGSASEKVSSSDQVVPMNGTINLETNFVSLFSDEASESVKERSIVKEYSAVDDTLNKYHPNYRTNGGINTEGTTVSLLLKDGTWDVVFEFPFIPAEISTSDFKFHHSNDEYARTCDGYLRCRITNAYRRGLGVGTSIVASSSYYAYDYYPQRIAMSKSYVLRVDNEEDYYRDVRIGLQNVEGATKVVVSQLDEWNDLPYEYEVTDFKKGFFIATVDREYATTFTITAYNKNGSTVSYPYVLAPITPATNLTPQITIKNDEIKIKRSSSRCINKEDIVKYKICSGLTDDVAPKIVNQGSYNMSQDYGINISNLRKGYYLLKIVEKNGKSRSYKFKK